MTNDPLVHQGGNESIDVLLRGDCQIPDLGAKGRDLPIPGEQITIDLLRPICTSAFAAVIYYYRSDHKKESKFGRTIGR